MFPVSPRAALLLGALLSSAALAQTAPAAPATTPAAPVKGASSATSRPVSALAVEVSAAVTGRIISCPASLKLSANAVCVYSQSGAGTLRALLKGKLGARAGEWKTTGKSSVLTAAPAAGSAANAFVLLSPLGDRETLVVVDSLKVAAPAAKVTVPAGVTKGQPYVLGSDLVGVVKVTSLGGGKYRLSTEDDGLLTVTAGQKAAQTAGGTVELPLAPVTDGRNLIFPLAGLRALGCTVTPAGSNLTVACGADSVGLRPIVF
ncbi:hypothetical protein [Deinococcus knuensis]|uniref:Uncharacterized protein n=1 Tax=Deinococcus knuensis TaxID=1837380 RepID=A0ABQ2SB87_9DEIO|nr:hypothetical protein [Deinococcus knuensis]GGS16197.1 hypothetical protein GCM10008961_04660 [Deinococcus knuensis]